MRSKASRWKARSSRGALVPAMAAAVAAVAALGPQVAEAQPFDCSSMNPSDWPAPAKPYFMIAFDTSGSMDTTVNVSNSCGYTNDRLGHGRCAVKNTLMAFSGQANFGLASFARRMTSCSGAQGTCNFNNCTFQNANNNGGAVDCPGASGCGPEPTPNATNSSSRAGANILVPMLIDAAPAPASNVPDLLAYTDNSCTDSRELFATGCTPLNGILRDMYRYYSTGWTSPFVNGLTFPSPLTSVANGERACRSVNVILVTDGGETCDVMADAYDAAGDLLAGFQKDGINWSVRTFVIDFGGVGAAANNIAMAGGTGTAYQANNEAQLSIALSSIIGSAIAPETCDNVDNNCNNCVDEGYQHYCNVPTNQCCTWSTTQARTQCLTSYQASISQADPDGNLALLPCTTAAQAQNSSTWLCYNPKEACDNADNNCDGQVDEGVNKCGSPLHCPQTEVCDSLDNDCDGFIDENVCSGCVPSQEICDGCDNDCDGVADDGIAPIPCGLASPANCTGQLACNPPQNVPIGQCAPGGGYGQCSYTPQTETCDGVDNDCDGSVDDNIAPVACVPPGTPGGIQYGGASQCQMGQQPCNGTCQGFVGPSAEVCDGIDNDCDGQVDEGVLGAGQPCGINQPPCQPGATACVNGALVCQGGVGPQPEQCDSIDNNCNGAIDDAPLADAPPAGQNGCWVGGGNCCSFPQGSPDVTWCPPPGADCNGNGSLMPPCNRGTLICSGGAWQCNNAKPPAPEVCDGLDNNCNGAVDDGNIPQEGQPCGSDTGECSPGTLDCTAGVLDCVGDVPPSPELCDGLDNDCNGQVDNGVQSGGPCTPAYDTTQYPGNRSNLPCQPGVQLCDAVNGLMCIGGVGPSPEVCDGIDNDCDGTVDELGPAPDGTNGQGNIGQPCGTDVGLCTPGVIICVNGLEICNSSVTPQPEQCDCQDNDCDGNVDNPNQNGPSLCGMGKDCVQGQDGVCGCAAPCAGGEFDCPPGQLCQAATPEGGTEGFYCVPDYQALCGDCSTKTVTAGGGQVVCAPEGTELPGCVDAPTCVCKNQNGCREPCFGVVCPTGLQCSNYGPQAGTCIADTSCWNFPCSSCEQACHAGSCVENPCNANACPADQACEPNADFDGYNCVPSCAGVTCPQGQACVDGACQPTCDMPCGAGSACDTAQNPPACVQCAEPCPSGCCNPATGLCGDCPCEGVVCPDGQVCREGSCFDDGGGAGGGSPTGSGGGTTTGTGTGTSGAGGGGGSGAGGIWGLPTGGGGCSCEVGAGADSSRSYGAFAMIALGLGLLRRRKSRGAAQRDAQKEVA